MATTSSAPGSAEQPPSTHKRTYQACIPCRRRKVRCDLGPVDNPHDPPCVRCRREKKDCFFTETRRKRKADDDGQRELSEEYVARNRRSIVDGRGLQRNGGSGDGIDDEDDRDYDLYDETQVADGGQPGGTAGKRSSLPLNRTSRPTGLWVPDGRPQKNTIEGREVKNETAAALFKSPIHNPGDALHLLVDAVARTGDLQRQSQEKSDDKKRQASTLNRERGSGSSHDVSMMAIDPAIANSTGRDGVEAEGLKEALQAWSRFRFVRAGWLTAREAVAYIDHFYDHMATLTPIAPPDFRSYASHPKLLSEEPMLTMTLLSISSRYMNLKGPAARSRSFQVHEQLWMYTQGMITRMFWGQEQFGGGFCGAGSSKGLGTSKGVLRSLGSIESLLLLSDWHPRSMHFPPGDDGDEISVPLLSNPEDAEVPLPILTGNPYAGWTEPALRSDKICWSLVSYAYTLSYELGVFDSLVDHGSWVPSTQGKFGTEEHRANRIGRLLHIYVSQTCGRLGYANILPQGGTKMDIEFLKMVQPDASLMSLDLAPKPSPDETIDNIQRAWAEITALMRLTNAEMFESKAKTREKIQNGDYFRFLEAHEPRLQQWLNTFDKLDIPPLARTVLMIEFEYTRTYINSLSLQAVLEQCTTTTSSDPYDTTSNNPATGTGNTPPALLSSKVVDFAKQNAHYIQEVVNASRSLLRHVIEGLVPANGLKHAPVRTHFRILSGAMFLLKTFALGGREEEVAISLELLTKTIHVLRRNVVDDVHLSLRIADLLDGLTNGIRTKFVRLPVHNRNPSTKRPSSNALHQRKPSKPTPSKTPISPTTSKHTLTNSSPATGGVPPSRSRPQIPNPNNFNINLDYLRTSGPLAGISTTLIDPNDSTITIMPPPDYIYNTTPPTQTYPPQTYSQSLSPPLQAGGPSYLSMHSPGTDSQSSQPSQFASPSSHPSTLGGGPQGPNHNQNPSSLAPNQQGLFSPQPHDYDWLTLDVNPLLQQDLGGMGRGYGAGGQWQGAFGPEIGESLEMLGMLADGSGFTGYGGGYGEEGGGWG